MMRSQIYLRRVHERLRSQPMSIGDTRGWLQALASGWEWRIGPWRGGLIRVRPQAIIREVEGGGRVQTPIEELRARGLGRWLAGLIAVGLIGAALGQIAHHKRGEISSRKGVQ
ncbi:MAG: hypothetical protein Kow0047_27690 [Anaerolineae bacterium]